MMKNTIDSWRVNAGISGQSSPLALCRSGFAACQDRVRWLIDKLKKMMFLIVHENLLIIRCFFR